MRIEIWLTLWLIFAGSVIYWDMQRWEDDAAISACHSAEVRAMNNKLVCSECKKYCEVKHAKKTTK